MVVAVVVVVVGVAVLAAEAAVVGDFAALADDVGMDGTPCTGLRWPGLTPAGDAVETADRKPHLQNGVREWPQCQWWANHAT